MEDSILKLITIGYALGIGIVGVMAYLGIKGTNEAIDYQNSRLRKHDESATWTPIPILNVLAGTLKLIVCSWLAVSPTESWWADEAISYIGTSTCDGIDGLLRGVIMAA